MFTANLACLWVVVETRGAEDKHRGIREVAAEVVDNTKWRAPTVFGGYDVPLGKDGFRMVLCSGNRKV